MKSYDHKKIEKKWQKKWEEKKLYKTSEKTDKPKFYALVEFPFPSGDGLHVGHVRPYIALDAIARKRRVEGFNVLYPMGWDAFGLPTENYAIKTGKQPAFVTKQNTGNFRKQIKNLGASFDWSREVNTTDPEYYKWTQWIFLKMFEKGLAYKSKMNINWCPKDKIGLANEEVVDGKCERCGTAVEKRDKDQWMLAITKYADRLDKDLDTVDFLEKIKIQQRNWIGRSEGAEIDFQIKDSSEKITVFTTRADTLYGVTYIVLAPEHRLIAELPIENKKEVEDYIKKSKDKTEIDRTDATKEKTGVEVKGVVAINPATGEEIPIWIADYVLVNYGTGAVMAVPAHDERDFKFAKKYDLEIRDVIMPSVVDHVNPPRSDKSSKVRKNAHAIVYDPNQDKYLIIRNSKFGWDTVVIGGIEENESAEQAAVREVIEETGYTNLKFIKTLGGPVQASYFAKHKDENRVAITTAAYFELIGNDRTEIAAGEEETNEILWVSPQEFVVGKMVNSELKFWLERMSSEYFPPYTGDGIVINSGEFDGLTANEAKGKITNEFGRKVVKYKLKDWVFSRQRYWGEPIPMINCNDCGWVPVPEKDLPVVLPKVKHYEPTDNGESPLSTISKWVNVQCPKCKGDAERETDTMPNWAGSSWYYLRYIDPKNKKSFADKNKLDKWTPVDWYNGGMEHTTLHLLYSRFWHKFLYDIGEVPTIEPYAKRTSHGLILAEGGEKMSKSKGNVVNPDDLVKIYGADSLRVFEMFMGPFDQPVAWSSDSVVGSRRFVERVWKLAEKLDKKIKTPSDVEILLNQSIKKVSEDIEKMSFNTAISTLMILLNRLEKEESVNNKVYETVLQLLAPFAPHVTEELWSQIGHKSSVHKANWPSYDASKLVSDTIKIAIQVNGKVRAELEVSREATQKDVIELTRALPAVDKWIAGRVIKKEIYVPGRLVSIVVDGN